MTERQVVRAVRAVYPGYDSPLHSKAKNPFYYGIRTLQRVDEIIADVSGVVVPQKTRKPENRKYTDRLYCRVSPETMKKVEYYTSEERITKDKFLNDLIKRFFAEREEKDG